MATGLVLHWPAGSGFKADDYSVIRYASDLGRCLHDFAGVQYGLRFFSFYRPLITLSLGTDSLLFGVEPLGYFIENLLAFLLAACLLFLILERLWPRRRGRLCFAFFPALCWLCHPVPVASLAWVAGRVDTHVAPLLLAALYLHLRFRDGGPRWPVWLVALLALATKESAIGFPLLALGLDFLDPRASSHAGWKVLGRSFPAIPYLLLLPLFFVFRRVVLGVWIGGYGFLHEQAIDPLAIAAGLWNSLSFSFLPDLTRTLDTRGWPELPGLLAGTWVGVLCCFVAYWALETRGERAARLAGVLLVSAGIYGPLAKLLPGENQRYAYLSSSLVLLVWTALAIRLGRGYGWASVGFCCVPLVWLLPAQSRAFADWERHDRFNASLRSAMQACDRILPEGEPVVLAGRPELAFHPQRFLWGLGSVLKPPFHPMSRNVITLRRIQPYVEPATVDLVASGLPCWVSVSEEGGERVPGDVGIVTRLPAEPLGFSGTLDARLLERIAKHPEAEIGFRVGEGFDGHVAICTSVGSLVLELDELPGKVVSLAKILGANATSRIPGPALPVGNLVWNAADLDKDSPFFLFWRETAGLRVARLEIGSDFSLAYLRGLGGR
ncbi:MAG: hypothetical protein ACE5F1_10855 [Planctomycetota bacterium]